MTRPTPDTGDLRMVEDVASPPSQAALLKNLLLYMGRRTPLRSARIQKLVYLVEADYADRTGHRMTDYRFRYDHYGMFSPNLREDVLSVVKDDPTFHMRRYPASDGGRGFELTLTGTRDGDLPDEVRASVDRVIHEYGHMQRIQELASAAKRTLPFVGTRKGGTVDWSILTDSCNRGDCNDELSAEGLKLLSPDDEGE